MSINGKKDLIKLRHQFERQNSKGVINAYIFSVGGYEGIIGLYGSSTSFLNVLKDVGFSRSYIHYIKNKLKRFE